MRSAFYLLLFLLAVFLTVLLTALLAALLAGGLAALLAALLLLALWRARAHQSRLKNSRRFIQLLYSLLYYNLPCGARARTSRG